MLNNSDNLHEITYEQEKTKEKDVSDYEKLKEEYTNVIQLLGATVKELLKRKYNISDSIACGVRENHSQETIKPAFLVNPVEKEKQLHLPLEEMHYEPKRTEEKKEIKKIIAEKIKYKELKEKTENFYQRTKRVFKIKKVRKTIYGVFLAGTIVGVSTSHLAGTLVKGIGKEMQSLQVIREQEKYFDVNYMHKFKTRVTFQEDKNGIMQPQHDHYTYQMFVRLKEEYPDPLLAFYFTYKSFMKDEYCVNYGKLEGYFNIFNSVFETDFDIHNEKGILEDVLEKYGLTKEEYREYIVEQILAMQNREKMKR